MGQFFVKNNPVCPSPAALGLGMDLPCGRRSVINGVPAAVFPGTGIHVQADPYVPEPVQLWLALIP